MKNVTFQTNQPLLATQQGSLTRNGVWHKLCVGVAICLVVLLVGSDVFILKSMCELLFSNRRYQLSDEHYEFDANGSATWDPTARHGQCVLPPLMPYYGSATSSFVRISLQAVLLGPTELQDYDIAVPTWKWLMTWAVAILQAVMLLVSVTTMLHKYFQEGHGKSKFVAYECFGVMVFTGPWLMNSLEQAAQYVINARIYTHMKGYVTLQNSSVIDSLTKIACKHEAQRYVHFDLMKLKLRISTFTAGATCSCFGIMSLSFMCTHIVPGLFVFSPQMAMILSVGVLISICLGARDSLNRLMKGPISANMISTPTQGMAQEMARRTFIRLPTMEGGLAMNTYQGILERTKANMLFFRKQLKEIAEMNGTTRFVVWRAYPSMLAFRMVVEMSMLQMTYIYSGMPWLDSIFVSLAERQAFIYFLNVEQQVLLVAWGLSALLNQALL